MLYFGRSNNGRCDMGLTQYPRQGDLRSRNSVFLCNVCRTICDREIFVAEIQSLREWIAVGSFGLPATFAFAIPRKEAACHRAPGNESNALINTQRNHFTLFLTIDQIVVVLHGDKFCPAICFT